MGFREVIDALLGISAYQRPANAQSSAYPQLSDAYVEEIRKAVGGNLQPIPTSRLRWYRADLETAQHEADGGNLRLIAQLSRSMQRDGTIAGLLSTRSGGLIRLPNKFYGDAAIAEDLSRKTGSRSVFDEMVPPAELEAINTDGIKIGVGVGELVPVPGRDFPVLVRLDPEYLIFRWATNQWYFQSIAGVIPIVPGNGRWVLHIPGARMAPWNGGLWPALGRAYIDKEHSLLHRANYSAKLANPARLAYAPNGATEAQRLGFFQRILAWGSNTVLEMPPGYEAKLLESNGRGIQVFQEEIDTCDREAVVAIAGQTVTTDGGTGFANADIHRTIREDLIRRDGESLAHTVNTQILPAYIAQRFGLDAVTKRSTVIAWDTSTPKELEAQARTLLLLVQMIAQSRVVFEGSNRAMNIDELATRFNAPLIVTGAGVGELAPPKPEEAKALTAAPVSGGEGKKEAA